MTQVAHATSSPPSQVHSTSLQSHDPIQVETPNFEQKVADSSIDLPSPPPQTASPRLFFDLFAGHSAPLSAAAKTANIDHFYPFDIEFNHVCDILNDDQFEILLKLAHSGLIGAIWSAPPCRLYSSLRKNDGGPPHSDPKTFWMVFLHSTLLNLPKLKNQRKYIEDQTSFALQFFNKVDLPHKNNLLTLWHGKNLLTNNSYRNARVILWQLQHASGAWIFSKHGP